jgi:hypothetical protein
LSASLRVLVGEIPVHVAIPDAVRPSHPDGRQLARLHQPVHRHIRHPQKVGHLSNGDKPGLRLVWLHV